MAGGFRLIWVSVAVRIRGHFGPIGPSMDLEVAGDSDGEAVPQLVAGDSDGSASASSGLGGIVVREVGPSRTVLLVANAEADDWPEKPTSV
jgi:hypothetical protein